MRLRDINIGTEQKPEHIFDNSTMDLDPDLELYPPQEEAVKAGLLDSNQNFLIASPTASGKTLLAELVMVSSIVRDSGKCLYVVPLNALAYEKYLNFRDKYDYSNSAGAGAIAKVGISTGDYESSSRYLERYDIIILTLEKLDSLTRLKPAWLRTVSVVVVDEVHVIGDDKRGPRLEGAMARFMSFNPAARIIALSATVANVEEFGDWLHARVMRSEWRPVPLKEEILLAKGDREILGCVIEEIKQGSQVLVFVNTKRGAASFARKIAAELKKKIPEVELESEGLNALAEKVEIGVDDLAEIARCGVAYHNSWLHPEQRRAIEDSFRKRILKVICCTPTLAMGVSLPAKTVIIRNYKFFTSGRGIEPMPVFWVKQVFGRAGRPEHDDYGTGIIVAKTEGEFDEIERVYIHGELERIESRFSAETMTEQILATIVSGAERMEQILDFLNSTFYTYQNSSSGSGSGSGSSPVTNHQSPVTSVQDGMDGMDEILVDLAEKDFIMLDRDQDTIQATAFGTLASRLYLSTNSALKLRDGIQVLSEMGNPSTGQGPGHVTISDFDLLLLLCICEEIVPLNVKDAIEIAPGLSDNREWLSYCTSALGSAIVAHAWIEEFTYQELKNRFGTYPGEIHNNIYNQSWMAYAGSRIARYLRDEKMYLRLRALHERIKHGVKPELLELVAIRGVGRVIARGLYAARFKTAQEVAEADVAQLEIVRGVGVKRAAKLKEEAVRQCIENTHHSRLHV